MNKFTKTIASIVAVVAFVAVAATSASAYTFTRNLTVGSTGADVTELQTGLKARGFLMVNPTGYFGNLTKAAVAAFQTANGVTPAAGYFGPLTQAKWNAVAGGTDTSTSSVAGCVAGAMFSSTTGAPCNGGTTSTTLKGTDGSIASLTTLSEFNNEEVGEGENGVKVAGFEVKASTDGDIALRSVKLTFDATGNSGSTRLAKYVRNVYVWQGSTKVGSASVDDFTKDSSNSSIYSKTITLSNSVVKTDSKEKFYVTVDGATTFDSADIYGDSWTVALTNVRYEDGSGVVTTDTSTATGNIASGVSMDFVSFSTSANTELKFSTDTATPDAQVVLVDDVSNTKDVVLTKGKIKVDGTSDVWLDKLPVTFTVTGATDVDAVTGSVKLTIDGKEFSQSVSTSAATATVTFDSLDLTLTAGKTYSFTVSADINDTNGTSSDFEDGDTLEASITSTNRDYVDVENSQGDQLSDSTEKSGTVTGKAQEFRASGIQVSLVSTETSVTAGNSANDDLGTFKIKFKVKASGDAVYVSSLVANSVTYSVDKSGTATTGNTISATITNVTDNDKTSVGNYEIEDGSEETFELIVTAQLGTGGTSGQYRATLTGVKWDTTDGTSPANTYTSNLDSFRTSYVGLN